MVSIIEGRAVVALASDPAILKKTRRFILAIELAEEFGFTDIDGAVPMTQHVGDALVNLTFIDYTTQRERRRTIPRLFDELQAIPPAFTGTYEVPKTSPLYGVLCQIMVHRGLNALYFDVAGVTSFADPADETIAMKFGKSYGTEHSVGLQRL